MGAKSKAQGQGRGREITGILLLGFGVFSVLSLVSMHLGARRMMGPGGEATATGLYSLAGLGAYLIATAQLVVAFRCFRGRPLYKGLTEILGVTGLLAAGTVLLHLPFAGSKVTLRGPGGALGQWLGEILASFVGSVGAALAATMLLTMAVLFLTNLRIADVMPAVEALGRAVAGGALGVARAAGRVVMAMFPERGAAEEYEDDDEEAADDETLADLEPVVVGARADEDDSDAVIIGDGRSLAAVHDRRGDEDRPEDVVIDAAAEDRRLIAGVVAEVAAAECAAEAEAEAAALARAELVTPALAEADESEADDDAGDEVHIDEEPGDLPVIVAPAGKAAVADTQALVPVPAAKPAEGAGGGPIIVERPFRNGLGGKEEALADKAAEKDNGPGFIRLSDGDFELPSAELLEYIPPEGTDIDRQALLEMAERLEQAMSNYGVRGKVKEIHMGPVVTMYEFAPAPGTRTGKIAQLENDLAMALEAQAVRIVAPIPGKAVVGVEVPNRKRETVYLKEIMVDDSFRRAGSKLQIALGKDIKGAPVSVNLAKMPHLLVAGTTGSGKSVTVNGMIASLLYNATPEEVRFIMVDPKMLELSIYEGIPHLLLPVVTDPKKANLALRWAVDEMERRYELLAKTGVRDIASYNAKVEIELGKKPRAVEEPLVETPSKKLKVVVAGADGVEHEVEVDADAEAESAYAALGEAAGEGAISAELQEELSDQAAQAQWTRDKASEEPLPRKLPYIVIVIDEFADLMMVAPKDVETSVARIAQKARAAGLHLILATQRPSVDVITGLIKANFPSRVALQVASKIDSRTILDQPGAETLLGNGDMLFSDRGTKLRRIHGAFLSDEEVHRVVTFLKSQAKPVYDMDILKPREDEEGEGEAAPKEDFHDALYDQAIAIVCDTRQASVSFIQRRLQIGYNRAARMVEQMERDGIVGPANGIKPREVLAPSGEYLSAAP